MKIYSLLLLSPFVFLNSSWASDCLSRYNSGEAFLYKNQCYYKDSDLELCKEDELSITVGEECFIPEDRSRAHEELEKKKKSEKPEKKKGPSLKIDDLHIISTIGVEVSAILRNQLRASGGNESSNGDHYIYADAKIIQEVKTKRVQALFIDLSFRNRDAVLDYQVKSEQNFHNWNRFRADGYLDRPSILASIGADFKVAEMQHFTVSMGSMAMNGLDPLKGKATEYYAFAPYNLIVRYGQGIKVDYAMKSKVEQLIRASFSVDDGDTIKGQPYIQPADSRANSYPSFGFSGEVQMVSIFRHFTGIESEKLKKHDLYLGYTGSSADTGSSAGEKRVQDDNILYMGYKYKLNNGNFEFRGASSTFTRNNYDDPGLGRRGGNIQTHGGWSLEVALTEYQMRGCNLNLYANRYRYKSDHEKADNEFTWGNVRTIDGYAVGGRCNDLGGFKGASFGVEYGNRKVNDPLSIGEAWSGMYNKNSGHQFNMTFGLKRDFLK